MPRPMSYRRQEVLPAGLEPAEREMEAVAGRERAAAPDGSRPPAGVRSSFFALQRRQAATTFSHTCSPPRERGMT